MAKGRMLNKKISISYDVNSLSCDTSRLLFTWLISHLDPNGCYYADPILVKNSVFPLREDITKRKVQQFLDEFCEIGLIVRYEVNKKLYLFCPSFDKNQPGLRKDREAVSDIPPYQTESGVNPELIRSNDGINPPEVQYKYKRSIKEVKDKVKTNGLFEIFWGEYPVKKGKGDAEKSFTKINPDKVLLQTMVTAIHSQKEERRTRESKKLFVPEWKHPATWLNQRCWEDEINTGGNDGGEDFSMYDR